MTEYTLYYYPGYASLPVHLALGHIGAAYKLVKIDVSAGEGQTETYRAINPHGQVPALEFDGFRMNQTIGILEFLAQRHPKAGLAPPITDESANASYHMWLAYLSTTLQERFQPFFHPDRYVDQEVQYDDVRIVAERYLNEMFTWIESQLRPGPYLLGERLSMPDFLLVTLIRWGRFLTPSVAERGRLADFNKTVRALPFAKRVLELEGV